MFSYGFEGFLYALRGAQTTNEPTEIRSQNVESCSWCEMLLQPMVFDGFRHPRRRWFYGKSFWTHSLHAVLMGWLLRGGSISAKAALGNCFWWFPPSAPGVILRKIHLDTRFTSGFDHFADPWGLDFRRSCSRQCFLVIFQRGFIFSFVLIYTSQRRIWCRTWRGVWVCYDGEQTL